MAILLNTPPLTVYEHMALDEQMARLASAAILRFYQWAPGPAVTFGYAQFVSEVRRALQEKRFAAAYTRRPTGGGVVFHTDDLTFSLIFSCPDRPSVIYQKLHTCIWQQLKKAGISGSVFNQNLPAVAYAPSVNHQANACFVHPVENDLLATDGQKMLGGAIRRFGSLVLYQGSLQLPQARENPVLKRSVIEAVRIFLSTDFTPLACDSSVLQAARELATTQYQNLDWVEKF
ncbi:MAG: hypothetical protein IKO35_05490 [Elusimicrobiaceae bacterium]|nr:hypothetical protein [Elusimicrobiaceae bacterium]